MKYERERRLEEKACPANTNGNKGKRRRRNREEQRGEMKERDVPIRSAGAAVKGRQYKEAGGTKDSAEVEGSHSGLRGEK